MTSPAFRLASSSLLALILMTAQSTCVFAAEITLEKEKAVVATPADSTKTETSDVQPDVKEGVTVKGTVESNVALPDTTVEKIIDKLALSARNNNEDLGKAQDYVDKYGTLKSHAAALGSDALNAVFMFKGVSQSSQAGDIILGEKLKLNSLGAAKLSIRKIEDDIESKLLTKILDLAAAVGQRDQAAIDEATTELKTFAGEDETKELLSVLNGIGEQDLNESTDFQIRSTKSSELSKRVNLAVQSAALNDDVVEEIKSDLHRYNKHRPGVLAIHRIARTALSVASLTPNFVGPASQAILFGYVMASGGTETSKVLKEVYMGKRLELRAATLREEIHALFSAYQSAVANKNAVLAGASRELLAHKIGASNAATLLRYKDVSDVAKDIEVKSIAAADHAQAGTNKKPRKNLKDVTVASLSDDSKTEVGKTEEEKADSKTESKRDRKAESKKISTAESKTDSEDDGDTKAEAKTESKTELKAETKTETKADSESTLTEQGESETEKSKTKEIEQSKSESDSKLKVVSNSEMEKTDRDSGGFKNWLLKVH